jgi:predicted DNA-binding protein with PD1-like motif
MSAPEPPAWHPHTRAGLGSFGRVLVIRLAPGEDVLPAMGRILQTAGITQAAILSGVASLAHATVRNIHRFPPDWPIGTSDRHTTRIDGPLEILAMQGNVAPGPDGQQVIHCHLDFSVGAPPSHTFGGHLVDDTIVGTTCEIVIAELVDLQVMRTWDDETRTAEIDVAPRLALD